VQSRLRVLQTCFSALSPQPSALSPAAPAPFTRDPPLWHDAPTQAHCRDDVNFDPALGTGVSELVDLISQGELARARVRC